MPRTDPVTGCQVMTNAEFWQSEATHEGKGRAPGELQADFYQEMADDEERCRQQMLTDTDEAYRTLFAYWTMCREDVDWTDEDPFRDWRDDGVVDFFMQYKPRRVIEVLHAELSQSFKETSRRVVSRVLFSGGRVKILSHDAWSFSGSMIDPPDGEENVIVLPDNWERDDEA